MQMQIRLSSVVLALLISLALVGGLIALRPPLTRNAYLQMAGMIAAAGLVVTIYNAVMSARARRRAEASEPCALIEEQTAETIVLPAADAAEDVTACPASEALPADEPLPCAAEEPLAPAYVPDAAEHAAEIVLPESLDALLDTAYEAAERDPLYAIAAYRRALTRYPDDSYMPYLIIELSTLYKRLGDYDAALALHDEALALPIIAENAVMVQEFQRSRRALRVVFDMLAAQETPALPFGEVPKELLAEADRLADGQ